MRERMKKKKNIIIGGLLAVVFLMSVGYAAFASQLSISGTANTSSWIIKITNIREKTKTSGVINKGTSYTDLTANFNCELTLPGDSITYEVTVENQGNIDASLKEVTKSFTNDKYIQVTYSGLYEGQMLYKQGAENSTAVMEVTVTFKDLNYEGTFTETITSNISINLNFVQEGNNVDTTKKYLVTYDSDGGTPVESEYYEWEANDLDNVTIPTKIGYVFGGWWTSAYGSGKRALAYRQLSELMEYVSKTENDDGLTLYAAWTPKPYTINYDGQGSTTNISPKNYTWTSSNVGSTTPKRKGYKFLGWYTYPNGKGLRITGNVTVRKIIENQYGKYTDIAGGEKGDEVTLYAAWEEKEFVIAFDSRGGSEVPNQTAKWTETLKTLPIPTKEGYTFDGWWNKSSGGTQVTTEALLSEFLLNDNNARNQTIYAHWIENS